MYIYMNSSQKDDKTKPKKNENMLQQIFRGEETQKATPIVIGIIGIIIFCIILYLVLRNKKNPTMTLTDTPSGSSTSS